MHSAALRCCVLCYAVLCHAVLCTMPAECKGVVNPCRTYARLSLHPCSPLVSVTVTALRAPTGAMAWCPPTAGPARLAASQQLEHPHARCASRAPPQLSRSRGPTLPLGAAPHGGFGPTRVHAYPASTAVSWCLKTPCVAQPALHACRRVSCMHMGVMLHANAASALPHDFAAARASTPTVSALSTATSAPPTHSRTAGAQRRGEAGGQLGGRTQSQVNLLALHPSQLPARAAVILNTGYAPLLPLSLPTHTTSPHGWYALQPAVRSWRGDAQQRCHDMHAVPSWHICRAAGYTMHQVRRLTCWGWVIVDAASDCSQS